MTTRLLFAMAFIIWLLAPPVAYAKRVPAPIIAPVIHHGIRYVVPNDKGTVAYIEAWDVAAGKLLWKKTVFRTWINPLWEHCNQWVFIKEMHEQAGCLILSNEKNKTYSLDLRTKRVRKLKARP